MLHRMLRIRQWHKGYVTTVDLVLQAEPGLECDASSARPCGFGLIG
jgi:hypothetical protein